MESRCQPPAPVECVNGVFAARRMLQWTTPKGSGLAGQMDLEVLLERRQERWRCRRQPFLSNGQATSLPRVLPFLPHPSGLGAWTPSRICLTHQHQPSLPFDYFFTSFRPFLLPIPHSFLLHNQRRPSPDGLIPQKWDSETQM